MADVAKEAGVSAMTVSIALRNDPRVAPKTRQRILEAAEKLGYARDPEVGRLMAYIRDRRQTRLQANLAFAHFLEDPKEFPQKVFLNTVYSAAKEHANRLGYSLHPLQLTEKGMTKKRMSKIVETRNIQGVILSPLPPGLEIDVSERFDAQQVAGVKFGYDPREPMFSRVNLNHTHAMQMAMNTVWQLGYQRAGLILEEKYSQRLRDLWLSSHLGCQYKRFGRIQIPPLMVDDFTPGDLLDWLKKNKPDLVFIRDKEVQTMLEELGYAVPEKLGVAYLHVDTSDPHASGIKNDDKRLGTLAVDHLISQILARRSGVSEDNVTLLVKGTWQSGNTTRRLKA